MKKFFVFVSLAIALCASSEVYAQSWLESLGRSAVNRAKNRAKERVEQRINEEVDKTVDKTLESAESAITGKPTSAQLEREAREQEAAREAQLQQQAAAREEAARRAAAAAAEEQAAQARQPQKAEPKAAELAYSKSDFVRGDEVIFEDNINAEQLGEFPSQWDLIEGSLEVAQLNGEKVIMAQQVHDWITPLFEDMTNYLPEKFTLEFDFWSELSEDGINIYEVFFHEKSNYHSRDFQAIEVDAEGRPEYDYVRWVYLVKAGDDYDERSGQFDNPEIQPNAWNHFALSFNKRAMKVYINGTRVANIPNTVQPNSFSIRFRGDGIGRMAHPSIKNIVLAKGAVPLYDRMMSEGKFITYGITFDVGKAVIKPESMGEITRIVKLMQENPTLKFSVEGHTDSTGSASNNQKLSEDRAKAIVDKLVENGIARDRLTSVGKGQNSPIADNSTDEGRAKNRRVEFVKL